MVTITSNANEGNNTIPISGVGTSTIKYSITAEDVSFGAVPVGESKTLDLVLHNSSNVRFYVNEILFSSNSKFIPTVTKGYIEIGESMAIPFTFTPEEQRNYAFYNTQI